MLKYKLSVIIIFLLSCQLNAGVDSSIVKQRFYLFQLVGGYNYSSFMTENNEWGGNYSYGVIFNLPISERFIINPSVLFSRSTNTLRKLKDVYFESDYIYRSYYDLKFDATFTDLILFLNYQAYRFKDLIFETGLGIGYSSGKEYYSKSFNFNKTDQVLGYNPSYTPGLVSEIESFQEDGSGRSYYADLVVNYSRFTLCFIYTYKIMRVFEIRNLHTISFLFGINL